MVLTNNQQVIRVWETYADNGFQFKTSQDEIVRPGEFDERRRNRLPILNDLLDSFLQEEIELSEFKSEIDGQNKRYPIWGFKGMNGMMFFNMLRTSAGESRQGELAELLRNVFQQPDSPTEASGKIRSLEGFVEQLRNEANDLRKTPRPGSIPYFLSYFWQLRAPDSYPIYYTSMVRAFSDLAIWEPENDLAESYTEFWKLNEEIRTVLENHTENDIHLWSIEHAFWYWQQRDEFEDMVSETDTNTTATTTLPDSYIPPIVSILPDLANHAEEAAQVAKETGQSVETLFENRLVKCLRMIGFEVDELGQGSGRNPDGIVKDRLHNYAIIYDAKVRKEGYSLGTADERKFQDYINREVPSLRAQGFRNVYFAVISGTYTDEARDAIRTLKINTDIQEVRLIEVEALLVLLENRLRNPTFDLGAGDIEGPGVQDFFAESGILNASDVREELGI